MTNEQARKILSEYLVLDSEEHSEFLDAIRTLIQPQADGDLISRQAVLDTEYQVKVINDIEYVMLSEIQMKMRKLPSVKPQEPSRDMEEIEEVINCDADAETKCKMISNILTAKPHYFEEQEPKTGHWIRQDNTKEPLYGWYFCSECNSVIGDKTKFCSNCGARMVEPKESEG